MCKFVKLIVLLNRQELPPRQGKEGKYQKSKFLGWGDALDLKLKHISAKDHTRHSLFLFIFVMKYFFFDVFFRDANTVYNCAPGPAVQEGNFLEKYLLLISPKSQVANNPVLNFFYDFFMVSKSQKWPKIVLKNNTFVLGITTQSFSV